jgi:hypothetical protein
MEKSYDRQAFPIRGLASTPSSPLFQGRFGRLFRSLPAARFGKTDTDTEKALHDLALKMSSDADPPKDGKDDEESGIPALYTYFGQFIDHDLTFDPNSSLQKRNDPNALTDYRTPAFDLYCVYGRGPDDQPYLYDGANGFLLGKPIGGGDPDCVAVGRGACAFTTGRTISRVSAEVSPGKPDHQRQLSQICDSCQERRSMVLVTKGNGLSPINVA